MSPKTLRSLALGLLLFTATVSVASIPGMVDTWHVKNEGTWGFRGFGLAAAMIFGLAGTLLASKRPENAVGWLFSVAGAAFAVITAGETYAVIPLIQGNDAGIRYQVAWLTSWAWVIFLGLIAFSILLFPSGTLPSRRWVGGARLMVVAFALGCVGFAFTPGSLNNMPERIANRYALPAGPVTDTLVSAGMFAFLAALVAAAVGVVQRYRSSRGLQKQQMKLFVFSAAAMAASMGLVVITLFWVPQMADFAEVLSSLLMMAIPVAMTVAILRYRLYDIDLVINRALVYGTLTAVLGVAYLGIVVLLQATLAPITRDSDLAIAGSTLAVAALFRPLRARIQSFIDQRFYRQRYDAVGTVAAFSAQLRDQVDLDSLSNELVAVVGSTMQPAHASLWLRADGPTDGAERP